MSCCDYKTLNELGQKSTGSVPIQRTTVTGHYIVPDYKAPSYNTLMHGVRNPSCAGFFNIMSAYGKNAANCNQQYSLTKCNTR